MGENVSAFFERKLNYTGLYWPYFGSYTCISDRLAVLKKQYHACHVPASLKEIWALNINQRGEDLPVQNFHAGCGNRTVAATTLTKQRDTEIPSRCRSDPAAL